MEKKAIIIFPAFGHKNILATHKSTLEITRENYVTRRGDCIVGINSKVSPADFPPVIMEMLKNDNAIIRIKVEARNIVDEIIARGSKKLKLTSKISMVIRKSNFIDERTLAIQANKSAKDLDRKIIQYLQRGGSLKVTIEILTQSSIK